MHTHYDISMVICTATCIYIIITDLDSFHHLTEVFNALHEKEVIATEFETPRSLS